MCFRARRPVGQLDICQHQPRPAQLHSRNRLGPRRRHGGNPVAKIQHQRFDIRCDNRLVLDDQHFGGQLGLDIALRTGDQLAYILGVLVEDRAASSMVKPSSAVSRKAWRWRGGCA
jgi:hypothetical protein